MSFSFLWIRAKNGKLSKKSQQELRIVHFLITKIRAVSNFMWLNWEHVKNYLNGIVYKTSESPTCVKKLKGHWLNFGSADLSIEKLK